jgi:hypothetical protein
MLSQLSYCLNASQKFFYTHYVNLQSSDFKFRRNSWNRYSMKARKTLHLVIVIRSFDSFKLQPLNGLVYLVWLKTGFPKNNLFQHP